LCIFAALIWNEAHIASSIKSGDRPVFEELFRSWYRPLCVYAYGFLKSREESEEIVQSMFIQFWEKRADIMIDSSLKSYMYRAVRNAALNRLKHEKVKAGHAAYTMSVAETSASPLEGLEETELHQRIQLALKKLPEQCRVVFEMSRFEELKYSEIAQRLDISVKTVENQMGKALRIMREQLHDYLPLIAFLIGGFIDTN
jgi:RNA polymerase sigma-70 factor (ECF subfamily)